MMTGQPVVNSVSARPREEDPVRSQRRARHMGTIHRNLRTRATSAKRLRRLAQGVVGEFPAALVAVSGPDRRPCRPLPDATRSPARANTSDGHDSEAHSLGIPPASFSGRLQEPTFRGRPGRACSSNPSRRSTKKRFRQRPTTSRGVLRRAPISSLLSPSAARRIILARWTSEYGSVYFPERRRSSASSSGDNLIAYGLVPGTARVSL